MCCDKSANYGRHNGDHITIFKCIKSTWCVPSIYMMFCNIFQPPQHFTSTGIAIQNQQHQPNKQKLRISEDAVKLELL